ncbi:helix-turn-helix domain-containing protein [Staphylococcus sp. GDY8P193P]|uniref:helix-turn-helix domain-containing protein n=1 Tax=Staphylococcus sp. GDY8P193P TaxID=2804171 RepID=UPI001AEC5D27|nr:helix-turn-helix domain-containing protein [Staphylococcus sp. GDY8P193P]
MAYEKVELVVAMMTGDIYMARIKEDDVMDTKVNESPLSSKLTIKDRQEIFYKYTNGHSMKKLAKEYNVHKDTIAYSVRKYKFEDDKHVG